MCGRYVSLDEAAIEREFKLVHTEWQFPASFNVAPSQSVPVIRSVGGVRQASLMRWGLVPFFAKGVPGKFRTHIARGETVDTKFSFCEPWRRGQRCIVPAAAFYEWQVQPDGRSKQPFHIRSADQDVFGFAAIWASSNRDDGAIIESFAIITVPANSLMATIHNGTDESRMPVILRRAEYDRWLTGTVEEAHALLKQYPADAMLAWPVSTRVNAPKNNDVTLIEPIHVGAS